MPHYAVLIGSCKLLNLLKAFIQHGFGEYALHAVDKVDFSSHILTPLLEYIASLASVVVTINPFNYELNSLLKLLAD